jgi:hypothetical protein
MEWATVAELGTAAGTLVLAFATFASVRSANRTSRLAERSLLTQIRPLLLPARLEDPAEKVGFQDGHWVHVAAGMALADVTDDAIYLAITLRNVGAGLAVLDGWQFHAGQLVGPAEQPDPDDFRRLTRDLYLPAKDRGFWQGTFRDPDEPIFQVAYDNISKREQFTIDVLYGDGEGGQRIITRFSVIPGREDNWITAVSHHWYVDQPDPR